MLKVIFGFLLLFCLGYRVTPNLNQTQEKHLSVITFQSNRTTEDQASTPALNGFYFATSKDKYGQRGWLLQIDVTKRLGSLYLPPSMRKLSAISLEPTGHISFRVDGAVGELAKKFSGQLNQSGFKGTLQTSQNGRKSSETAAQIEVSFFKVDTDRLPPAQAGAIYGLYSDKEYNRESGDLVGADLILFPSATGIQGIFTSYEDGMIPYAILNAKYSRKKIEFGIEAMEGKEHYSGSVLPKFVKLNRDDAQANPKGDPWVLPKKSSLTGMFSNSKLR